jgi:outer membrane protein
MMGSKSSLLAAFAVAVAATSGASAQANLKIGVINVAVLIEQSPQAATVQKKLQDEFGPRQRDLAAKQESLRTQVETFQRDSPVMGEAERANLERNIREAQREYQRAENELREDLDLRQNEEIGQLQRAVLTKAQEYARAEKYDLVLTDSNVIFGSTAVDITAAVLAMLKPPAAAPAASQ